ncbi:RNA binding protein-like protein [Tricharina praecox]|uniref:RNA binding protein-like protein n=1 Tax=Tricharina praecox TaxID=43433 RepID=UPI00221E7500|nr:RNA binding protein-like protein [Tricharina praecox]KAI5859080.1 RNA binding protein-like protein [Tricharina praecox]
MARGNAELTKIIYKGKDNNSYVVIVDSAEEYQKWKKDQSVPLAQVLSGWKIFTTHKHGAQGIMDTASNSSLENEFGTSNEEECVKKILRDGSPQTKTNPERQGDTNMTDGSMVAH